MSKQENSPVFSEAEIDELIERFREVEDPGDLASGTLYRFIQTYFSPTVVGVDHIPDRPTLFVGNHSLFGIDGAVIMPVLWHEAGRRARPMADTAALKLPVSDRFTHNGMILAHPRVCDAMMQDGEDLLVYPGGSYESVKPADELKWRERYASCAWQPSMATRSRPSASSVRRSATST